MAHLSRSNFSRCLDGRVKLLQRVEKRSGQAFELFAAAIEVVLYVSRNGPLCQRSDEILFGLQHITKPPSVLAHPACKARLDQCTRESRPNRGGFFQQTL